MDAARTLYPYFTPRENALFPLHFNTSAQLFVGLLATTQYVFCLNPYRPPAVPDARKFVVTPSKNLWFSFCCKVGGDQISLVAKVKNIPLRDAALFLLGEEPTASKPTAPQEQGRSQPATSGLAPLSYLEADHDAVTAIGIDPRIAAELGIGYRTKGQGQGSIMIPVRDDTGTLRGYVGIQEATFLPKDFQPPENVIAFKKKA